MQNFRKDDDHKRKGEEKKIFKVRSRRAKEKLLKRNSLKEYGEMKYVLNRIESNLEHILEKKKYSLEQIDSLSCDFAKLVARVSKMNSGNLHKAHFSRLTKSDLSVLNSHLKTFIDQSTYYSFGAIMEETNKGEGIKVQIGEMLNSEPELNGILSESIKKRIFADKRSVFKGMASHEKKVKELSHMLTMQMSFAYGYIISKDMKNYIKTDPGAAYEKLSGEELEVLGELYHLVSVVYPSEIDGPLDLFPAGAGRKLAKPNPLLILNTSDWRDKVDWVYSKIEEMISEQKLLTLKEKEAFDKAVESLANEIAVPQKGDTLESTREKAKFEINNPLFKAYLFYLNGDLAEFAISMEIAKKGLIRVMYKIDADKSLKKTE